MFSFPVGLFYEDYLRTLNYKITVNTLFLALFESCGDFTILLPLVSQFCMLNVKNYAIVEEKYFVSSSVLTEVFCLPLHRILRISLQVF